MKFLDRVKDLFSDEEEIIETREIEVEEQEEHKLPTFMRNKLKQEEEVLKQEEKENEEEQMISDRDLIRTNHNFSFPIEFNDNDFSDTTNYSSQNILVKEKEREKTVSELYAKKEEPKPIRFRPTPIISPVYGVLDKNYKKDEVLEKEESNYEIQRPSRQIDFESVRKKAFGTLTDDLKDSLCENCEYLKEVKVTKKVEKIPDDNLLYDIVKDDVDDISIDEASENYFDYGVAYEPKDKTVIEETTKIKIINHNDEEPTAEKIEVKEQLPDKDLLKEEISHKNEKEVAEDIKDELPVVPEDDNSLELSDDLFDLIDSMYEEGDE